MQSKYLVASGAVGASGSNRRVYKVTAGASDACLVLLKVGGTSGTVVWGGYAPANESVQLDVPGVVADFATITGKAPYVTIEYAAGTSV